MPETEEIAGQEIMLSPSNTNIVQQSFLKELHLHIAGEAWMCTAGHWIIDDRLRLEALLHCGRKLEQGGDRRLGEGAAECSRKALQALGRDLFAKVKPMIRFDRSAFLIQYAACERVLRQAIERGVPVMRDQLNIDSASWIEFMGSGADDGLHEVGRTA
ncbi:hypothetical protein [uncultured Limimaricola sp.]|uniref:hypothetical protein n=1 Tax=uncultured Limimaricola sp. TaxID=2211667 RepID=UPI0030F6BB54